MSVVRNETINWCATASCKWQIETINVDDRPAITVFVGGAKEVYALARNTNIYQSLAA